MRAERPNTDQICEVYVSNGDKTYAEYMFDPSTSDREPKANVFESFIPVHEGEQITVNIKFQGTVLHGAADILADGAFVFDRRIEGDRKGRVKFQARKWKAEDVYNVPGALDAAAMHSGTAVVGGNLYVKKLHKGDVPLFCNNGGKLGLGSIAVIISVNQHSAENYSQKYKSQTVGKWRDRALNHADGGIIPTHELEFRMEDDEVHFNRQQRHKRHGEQTRFGRTPWAIFVFHYRSQSDIQQAGCILRPKKLLQTESYLGDFTFADPDAIMKKRLATRAKNEREKAEAAEMAQEEEDEEQEDADDFDNDGQRSDTRSVSASDGFFVSREHSQSIAAPAKKRLGGDLLGVQSVMSNATRRDGYVSGTGIIATQGPQPQRDWQDLFGDTPPEDNIDIAHHRGVNNSSTQLQGSISGNDQGGDFDFNFEVDLSTHNVIGAIDQGMHAGGFDAMQAPAAAPVAKMYSSSPSRNHRVLSEQQGHGDVVQSTEMAYRGQTQPDPPHLRQLSTHYEDEEQGEPSALAQMISSAVENQVDESKAAKAARLEAKHAKKAARPPTAPKGKPVFDSTAKTGYGYGNPKMSPGQPMAPTREAMQQLNAGDNHVKGMLQNFLQSQDSFPQYGSISKSSPQSVPYQRPWETAKPARVTQRQPMSPAVRIAQPVMATNNIPPSPRPAQPSPHTPIPSAASAISRKRSASITSRESTTSSKRSQATDRANRKAALLAAMQEKQKARDSAAKQLEEQRRAREEMDRRHEEEERQEREAAEAEETELAALEVQLAGADAEVEAIREQGRREAEEARTKELERQREGEE